MNLCPGEVWLADLGFPKVHFLEHQSVVNVQGIGSIPIARLERKLGTLPDQTLREIQQALLYLLDMQEEED